MPLQKPLRGISDLLGLYEGGEVKAEWSGVIAPTLDAMKFLAPPEWRTINPKNMAAVFTTSQVTIPDGERWILWHIGGFGQIPLLAGDSIGLQPFVQTPASVNVSISSNTQHNTFEWCNSGNIPSFSQSIPGGLWLDPGTSIGVVTTAFSGVGPVTVGVGYQISRFRL